MLNIGNHIWIGHGYSHQPRWLVDGVDGYNATVSDFIPGQFDTLAAVIEFDNLIALDSCVYQWAVLELRWYGTSWHDRGVVHVELCESQPKAISFDKRHRGEWVESHASYRLVELKPKPAGSILETAKKQSEFKKRINKLLGRSTEYQIKPVRYRIL